jgi:hypothetical protein
MRAIRRSAFVGVILLLALALNVQVTEAGRLWCKADPVVMLDGRLISVNVSIPIEYVLLVDGPVQIEITTPPSVDRYLIVNDLGYLRGSVVTFKDSDESVTDGWIPVHINASVAMNDRYVSSDEVVPLQISILTDGLRYMTALGTVDGTTMHLTIRGR